ncbi:unnamed protein product [Dovyalis caffra]|uniref:Uncharacterized protein n=1 Tax=Dovyalis caffra TaxID=77055 RepID=A0AAV1SPK6_9ROSI|nr:unnamed protein product [Dovyalis caffra]
MARNSDVESITATFDIFPTRLRCGVQVRSIFQCSCVHEKNEPVPNGGVKGQKTSSLEGAAHALESEGEK